MTVFHIMKILDSITMMCSHPLLLFILNFHIVLNRMIIMTLAFILVYGINDELVDRVELINQESESMNVFDNGIQLSHTNLYILDDVLLKKDSQGIIQVINDADYKEVECLDENIYTSCKTLFIKEGDILRALRDITKIETISIYSNVYIYQVDQINLLIQIDNNGYIKAVTDIRVIKGSNKNELYLYKDIVLLKSVYGFMQVASDPLDIAIGFDKSVKGLYKLKIESENVTMVIDKRIKNTSILRRIEDAPESNLVKLNDKLYILYDILFDYDSKQPILFTSDMKKKKNANLFYT